MSQDSAWDSLAKEQEMHVVTLKTGSSVRNSCGQMERASLCKNV